MSDKKSDVKQHIAPKTHTPLLHVIPDKKKCDKAWKLCSKIIIYIWIYR